MDKIEDFYKAQNSKVIYVCEEKNSSTLTKFNEDLINHDGKPTMIQSISCDMSPSFIKGIKNEFPDSKIIFDKLHLMKMMNRAVDEVRKREQLTVKELKNSNYLWYLWLKMKRTSFQSKVFGIRFRNAR